MAIWLIAALAWLAWSWKTAACVLTVAFTGWSIWQVAEIGRIRIMTERLIETSRLRDAEIGDIVEALFREEM